ncbi:type 1 glutamine amidotransferase domain-containing protein [Candidatus Chloroploca asiatica]|uniref:Thiamine biosynthesis protein ThiJ n=1 Tax=Candidatus Chloroploca asiatica TaxID=1506545 RepID=A0A2H3KKL4_9CHLR|nr:type 1 glutamine amidotransferase domain-containing protein [Candidatus Chloroploca asiatica]PDV97746.1 thiamine biosynthesis protein ThiJ [Candidatus Chloroploca asiatica]
MTRKILVVLSEYGYWGEELIGPLDVIDEHGYEATFLTPTGKRPYALPPSKEPGFFDPPLDKVVVDEYYARKTTEVDDSGRLANPLNLEAWFPERPYFNSTNFGHALEDYYTKRDACWKELEQYDALLMVGGSGPMIDMCNNIRLHDVILGFLAQGKLIAAECYAVTALAFARDFTERKSIIWGKHVTGHAIEYDWHDGTGVLGIDHNFKWAFYPLEFILRDATGPDGQFHGGVGRTISTILDYPFLSGRSTQDSRLVGELMVQVLENGLRRYGW